MPSIPLREMIKTLTMQQHQGTLGWDPYIESHPNVPWCCAIVVHKKCKDHSPSVTPTSISLLGMVKPSYNTQVPLLSIRISIVLLPMLSIIHLNILISTTCISCPQNSKSQRIAVTILKIFHSITKVTCKCNGTKLPLINIFSLSVQTHLN